MIGHASHQHQPPVVTNTTTGNSSSAVVDGQNNKVILPGDDTRYELSKHYRKCLCWSKRTIIERSLVVITAVLFIVCLALLLLNILLQARLRDGSGRDNLCITKECITAAASLLSKIDTTTNPCKNFYQFACGNYIEKNTVPDDHYHRSLIQTMQDDIYIALNKLLEEPIKPNDSEAILKVKKLYSSCMNTSSVEDGSVGILLNLLSESGVGEWPVLQKSWNRSRVDLERMLSILHVYEVQPFFHTIVLPDDRNTSMYLLHLYSGSPVLSTQYYLNATEGEHELYLAAYRELILETLRLLGAEQRTAFADVDAMLDFEKSFANLTQESYESLNAQNSGSGNSSDNGTSDEEFQFNRLNISQLEENVPELKWSLMVKYVFDQVGVNAGPVAPEDLNVVVHCETYLQHLMTLINHTAPRTVTNYLAWRFVIKYMPYLDIHFRRLYYDFRRQVPNLSDDRTFFARWKECVNVVSDGFGMALASLFVNHQYDKESEKEVREMVKSLKQSFTRILPSQTWLDGNTKQLCREKVEAMSEKIGYPQYILDPEQLDKDYVGLDISDDHFLNNILHMNRFEVLKELNKITRPVDKEKDWFVEPLVVNAFYEATGNSVIFPAGILRSPVFHPSRPKFLNYGTLGVVIGHEITHGFDNNGRRFDKGGNLTQWWPDEVADRFKEIASCFSEQYSQYPIEFVGQNVNGNQTLDENICDNAGLQQSYEAYRTFVRENGEEPRLPGIEYSNEQIFFLRYAQIWCEVVSREGHEKYLRDNHAPGRYRANGALMNSPQFSATFNCPVGSPMNPSKKCKLWG